MPNPFMQFRQRNILAPDFSPGAPTSTPRRLNFSFDQPAPRPQTPPSPYGSYEDELMGLQNQMGPGLQAYKKYLTELPNRDDYKPNVMTRVAAGLTGFSQGLRDPGQGVRVASDMLDSGYNDAVTDYRNKGVGLKEQAGLEQDELDSKIKALQNARAMGLKYDEFELKRLVDMAKTQNDTTTANAAMTRATAYAKAQQNGDYDMIPQQDGSVLAVNKKDKNDTKIIPAHTVAAGQLGVARGQLGVAQTNAKTQQGMLGVAQENANTNVTNAATRYTAEQNRIKNPNPRVQQDAEDLALRQMASDPLFKDFIKTDDKGFLNVIPDDGSDDYQDFITALNAKTEEALKGRTRRGGGR
jgi:hypothetical protein